MAPVSVRRLTRRYGPLKALDDVSIEFSDGGFYGLLGPSGSGKTTLLRLIAGFDPLDGGSILIDGEDVGRVPVERRRIGMVFQSYALFPNMSVADNVGFGLSVRGAARAEIDREVGRALELVRLEGLGARRPHQLSGGQRQRVALARAIVTRPRVLLLDEPLGALDRALRDDMQVELKRIQREVGLTTIFVTHDQEEALTLSDRIGILKDGRLVEEGPPEEIYNRPQTAFGATFLGHANLLEAEVEPEGLRIAGAGSLLPPPGDRLPAAGSRVLVALRPERIAISAAAPGSPGILRGRVVQRLFAGSRVTYFVDGPAGSIRVVTANAGDPILGPGAEVNLHWADDAVSILQR